MILYWPLVSCKGGSERAVITLIGCYKARKRETQRNGIRLSVVAYHKYDHEGTL